MPFHSFDVPCEYDSEYFKYSAFRSTKQNVENYIFMYLVHRFSREQIFTKSAFLPCFLAFIDLFLPDGYIYDSFFYIIRFTQNFH